MAESENEKVVRKMIAAYNNGDVDAWLSLGTDDMVYVGPSGTRHDKAMTRQVFITFQKAFHTSQRIERIVSHGNTVWAETNQMLQHRGEYLGIPATNKTIELPGVTIVDFEAGKIKLSKYYVNIRRLEQALRS